MDYFLFWSKITAKRAMDLVKQSPIIFIWVIILIFAFAVGWQNRAIEINPFSAIILIGILIVFSAISSLWNYQTIHALISYSKSNLPNNKIRTRFFIKRSFRNNLPLIIFVFILLAGPSKTDASVMLPAIIGTIFSLALSFFIMYLKNRYVDRKIKTTINKKSMINSVIKRALHDYFTPDFFVAMAFCYAIFGVLIFQTSMDLSLIKEINNPFLVILPITTILSIGSMSINETIFNMNWKFFSIIYPQKLSAHIKKIVTFLFCTLGSLLIVSILISLQIGVLVLFRILYNIMVLLLFSVYNAFTRSNILIKGIRSVLFAVLVIWIGNLHLAFLLVLILPVLIMALMAKDDFYGWYLQ